MSDNDVKPSGSGSGGNDGPSSLSSLSSSPSSSSSSSSSSSKSTLKGAMAGNESSTKEAFLGLLSGMAFGLVSPTVGHPFDTVKTKMQAEPAFQKLGIVASIQKIYHVDGLKGFYRGFIPPLVGSVAYRGILFSAYSGTYATCSKYELLHNEIPYTGGLRPSVLIAAFAASVARATIESPLDFIKVRFQVGANAFSDNNSATSSSSGGGGGKQQQPSSSSLSSVIRTFASSPISSIAHLYHGYVPTLLRTMGLLGSFFVMVDYSVRYIPEVINAPLFGPFFKGGICATAAWCFAFPFETTKSVIQADTTGKYKNVHGATWKVMKEIVETKGIRGLYRGFGPGASRSFVANGTSMVVYNWFQDNLRS